jgi:hypothetical protein
MWVENSTDLKGERFKGLALLVTEFMQIINAPNAGDDMPEGSLSVVRSNAGS